MSQGFPSNDPNALPPLGGSGGSLPNPYGPKAGQPSNYASSYAPTPGYGGPYQPPGQDPPRKSRTGCIVATIVLSILGIGLLMCGGCLGLGIFAIDADSKETARQLSVDYRNHPQVKEQVGEVQEVTYNWNASFFQEDDDSTHVYDVRGDKGTAQFVVVEEPIGVPLSVTLRNGKGEWNLDEGDGHEEALDHEHGDVMEGQ